MTQTETQLRRTPLYEAHVARGAKIVPFAGWEMPLSYGSAVEEHQAVRSGAGLFDVSHMGQVEIRGPEAQALVQRIITNDASTLRDGDELYTVACRENGGLVDDLIVARLAADRFFLVVNAATYDKDLDFMRDEAAGGAVQAEILPQAEAWAMMALQGPRWAEVLQKVIGPGDWQSERPFRMLEIKTHHYGTLLLSTTGYTGEPGCELLCLPGHARALWEALTAAGARPIGLAARDTLRLEKGYALSGQDFTEANNPLEAGLAWVVKLEKPEFSGKAALVRVADQGPGRRFVGLLPEGRRIARHGMKIFADGKEIGEVTSGGHAPSLGRPVAMGYVEASHARLGNEVEIDLGNTRVKARIARRMFYPAS